MTTISNPWLEIQIDAERGRWSVAGCRPGEPALSGLGARVLFRQGSAQRSAPDGWRTEAAPHQAASLHGPLRTVRLAGHPSRDPLQCRLEFAVPENYPFVFWRMELENRGRESACIRRIELLSAGPAIERHAAGTPDGRLEIPGGRPVFFSNGWQSWNYTGAYGRDDRFRRTRLGPLTAPMRVNAGTPHPARAGHFGSDFFGLLGSRESRTGVLAGFLSQQEHFGSLEARLNPPGPSLRLWANGDGARLDPGSRMLTDWACMQFVDLDAPDPFGPYFEAVARQHGLAPEGPAGPRSEALPTGWCSWYYYFGALTAGDVRANVQAAAGLRPELPLDMIQIDDGFQTYVGDWFSFTEGFPEGVAPLAREIEQAGFTPGLWLAPFIVHPRSELARDHPDWLLRSASGRPVNAGYSSWGVFTTALDLTHPPALEYVREVIAAAAHGWGYPYLKLDFLYAAALPGRYRDPTRTRAQVLRAGLQAIREAAGENTTLLGCGCPLGPAVGLVDAMRIGADVAPDWRPRYKGLYTFIQHEPDYPATRNAVQNAMTRAGMHRRLWINDPDCLLLRPDSGLTPAEARSLATVIALSGGAVLLSDDLNALPPERLKIAEALLPAIDRRPVVADLFDSPTPARLRLDLENTTGPWHLLALFNWEDRPRSLALRLEEFGLPPAAGGMAREFWSGQVLPIFASRLPAARILPHGVRLYAVRPAGGSPQYLGSDLHISQGLEVLGWQAGEGRLEFSLERPGRAVGRVDLRLPAAPRRALIEGETLRWEMVGPGRYRFFPAFSGRAGIELRW